MYFCIYLLFFSSSSLQVKISIENLSNMVPDPLYSMYHYSHPPLLERLRAINEATEKRKRKGQ
jgi:Zn-dependent protease with chaperone function